MVEAALTLGVPAFWGFLVSCQFLGALYSKTTCGLDHVPKPGQASVSASGLDLNKEAKGKERDPYWQNPASLPTCFVLGAIH